MTKSTTQVRCISWDSFVSSVRAERYLGNRIFRGQRDLSWGLVASFHRTLEDCNKSVDCPSESKWLERFKDGCMGLPGFEQSRAWSENEWWAKAQHHGLLTPLLDWTRSPFIAAFFALVDAVAAKSPGFYRNALDGGVSIPGSVAVWEMALIDELWPKLSDIQVIVGPIDRSHRQRAQAGVFTRMLNGSEMDLEKFLVTKGGGAVLRKFEIQCNDIWRALADLQRMNITFSTLFPDADGVARHVNTSGIIWLGGLMHEAFEQFHSGTGLMLGRSDGAVADKASVEIDGRVEENQ
ncbi:MAG: FRG domain-containing protein [Phycisphaerales bacterium]|nr:FRG domain-containing protein [Phycisphaerales bacterium]